MSRDDEPEADRDAADKAVIGGDRGEPSNTKASASNSSAERLWLDIGKTVVAGVITAAVLQFIRSGPR